MKYNYYGPIDADDVMPLDETVPQNTFLSWGALVLYYNVVLILRILILTSELLHFQKS